MGQEDSIVGPSWQDITDDHSRKNMALCFFAPRDLDGEPIDPYLYLSGQEGDEVEEKDAINEAQHQIGSVPLFDFCRSRTDSANAVNFLIVADIIFHWDNSDSYIQPTTPHTWMRDLQQLLKTYARTTTVNVYTSHSPEKLEELNVNVFGIQDLPLDPEVWLNMPTFQQKYGFYFLLAGILGAAGTYGMIYLQNEQITDLNRRISSISSKMPRQANFKTLEAMFDEQETRGKYRHLYPLISKDVAHSIQTSGMRAQSFEVTQHNPQQPPKNLLATIEAQDNVYRGWLQQEPVAKALLAHSVTMAAIRKPPTGSRFKLEALIQLDEVEEKVRDYQKKLQQSGEQPVDNIEGSQTLGGEEL